MPLPRGMVTTQVPIGRKGRLHGKAGMESEEGTAFLSSFLGASRVSNGISRPDGRSGG